MPFQKVSVVHVPSIGTNHFLWRWRMMMELLKHFDSDVGVEVVVVRVHSDMFLLNKSVHFIIGWRVLSHQRWQCSLPQHGCWMAVRVIDPIAMTWIWATVGVAHVSWLEEHSVSCVPFDCTIFRCSFHLWWILKKMAPEPTNHSWRPSPKAATKADEAV